MVIKENKRRIKKERGDLEVHNIYNYVQNIGNNTICKQTKHARLKTQNCNGQSGWKCKIKLQALYEIGTRMF